MKHYKHIILFLLCIVFSTTVFGGTKSSPNKPKWVIHELSESSIGLKEILIY